MTDYEIFLSGAVEKNLNLLYSWSYVYFILTYCHFLLDLAEQKKQRVSEIKAGIDEVDALVLPFPPI